MNILTALLAKLTNENLLVILISVLTVFVVLLTVLGIIFIIALRRRRPVIKVVMAPPINEEFSAAQPVAEKVPAPVKVAELPPVAPVEPVAEPEVVAPVDDDREDEAPQYITEGSERVHYNRSYLAKLCQLTNESKEWYTALKNELLSYDKIKERTSWRRETFRLGRNAIARIAVRGKTLCLLLAVEPAGYEGTKYKVEDVSDTANTVDTPTLFRIKSARRLKYAKEMIAGIMKELRIYKKPDFEPQDYFMPYEGDMALMERGLVKRVVSGTTRVYRIEEVDADEQEELDDSESTEVKDV
ncbi:MAG: hypothetical protein J1G07_01535 [Clostridiales bacterium]|nr:hypothetical protein [Clostridiales bacterium]